MYGWVGLGQCTGVVDLLPMLGLGFNYKPSTISGEDPKLDAAIVAIQELMLKHELSRLPIPECPGAPGGPDGPNVHSAQPPLHQSF